MTYTPRTVEDALNRAEQLKHSEVKWLRSLDKDIILLANEILRLREDLKEKCAEKITA